MLPDLSEGFIYFGTIAAIGMRVLAILVEFFITKTRIVDSTENLTEALSAWKSWETFCAQTASIAGEPLLDFSS